jgi:hypothetical protein
MEVAMGKLIEKRNESLKILLKQKGQGLTEFVLILAFCVAIGWAANEAGFMDAIGAVFDSGKRPETVTAAIGGGEKGVSPTPTPTPDPENPNPDPNPNPGDITYNEFDWGTIDPNLYYKKEYKDEHASRDGGNTTIDFTVESGKEDRLITDQVALANLATYFIGKTQRQVKDMLKNEQTADMGMDNNGQNVVLGHLIPKKDENGKNTQGIRLSTNMSDDNLKPEYQYEIFKWMKNPTDPESVTVDEDGTYMYMVSDYIVSQGWADKGGSNQANGIHLRFEYDYSGQFGTYDSLDEVTVVGVHIAIDPGSQNNKKKIASSNGQSSSGLDVQVRKISETENQVIFKDTGDAFDINGNYEGRTVIKKDGTEGTVNGGKSAGLYNWYHESYRDVVIQYLHDFWVVETISSGTVENSYSQGDIIKIKNDFYVVTKTGTQIIDSSKNQTYLEANGPLVKITNGLTNNYNTTANFIHENDLKTFNTDTYFQYRGFAVTLSNGDVYIYVGPQGKSYKVTADFVANSVDANGDPLFIKVGNVSYS